MKNKKRIVILTGAELRHSFFRKQIALNKQFEVVCTVCEGKEQSLEARVRNCDKTKKSHVMLGHVNQREQSEQDFFGIFNESVPDYSNPIFIEKGTINDDLIVQKIISLKPDIILVYGSSVLKGALVELYGNQNKILNVHLGLSPYYRGSGTNFWALVNKQPECVGATFMFLNKGIDTGAIIHQIRPRMYKTDTIHSIGNRLIIKAAKECAKLIKQFDFLTSQNVDMLSGRLYLRKDFDEDSVKQLYANFKNSMIEDYLKKQKKRNQEFPIVVFNKRAGK